MKGFAIAIISLIGLACNAQIAPPKKIITYEAAVHFSSICCGTTSDNFLKDFVSKFNKYYKVKVPAQKLGGCGREGEFYVLFSLEKIKKSVNKQFLSRLKTEVDKQNQVIKTEGQNKGPVSIANNVGFNDLQGCRQELQPF